MSGEPDIDVRKWSAPAASSEVTIAVLQIRKMQIKLYEALKALAVADQSAMHGALSQFLQLDVELAQIIDDIGGLPGRRR